MNRLELSPARGAIVAGGICLAILGGMFVTHAWPLWTGEPIRMRVTSAWTGESSRGEHVQLRLAENRLWLGGGAAPKHALALHVPLGFWPVGAAPHQRWRSLRGEVVYVQLEPDRDGVLRAVSISRAPVAGQRNLRGRVTDWDASADLYDVEYGVESYFVEQGTAPTVAKALADAKGGVVEIAVTSSGAARTRAVFAGPRRW